MLLVYVVVIYKTRCFVCCSFDRLTDWQLTNSCDLKASLGCLHCDGCSLTSIICDVQQWLHWLACPFFNVVLPWFMQSTSATTTIHCSCRMIFGNVSWRQTWLNHYSLRRLTVKAPDVRRGYWPVAIHIPSFYALCLTCKASFFITAGSGAYVRPPPIYKTMGDREKSFEGSISGATQITQRLMTRPVEAWVCMYPTNWSTIRLTDRLFFVLT